MMKKLSMLVLMALAAIVGSRAQSIVGTWQLTDTKNCVEKMMKESDTEKELKSGFGSSSHRVARVIAFNQKGMAEESIKSAGKKKGEEKIVSKYQIKDGELHLMDKKSGIVKERFVIEEFEGSTLRVHRAERDCEVMTFTKIK
ncbi:MAG: lipocalin family protein [Cyclobacteriaceae bacterium]